ncbi:hypothetical protein AB0M20_42345, partial [Actinoplanes sp. NPDC051633]
MVGEHPVVFAGAGSHAGAYLPGEYLVQVPLDLPRWTNRTVAAIRRLIPGRAGKPTALALPYLDYHRGDGLAVGPGQDREWQATLIEDGTGWVHDYAGLWGLDTKDPFGGERAPAGPRYERNGTVRRSWGQPVAWAGLDREPPDEEAARADLAAARAKVVAQLGLTRESLAEQRSLLRATRTADRVRGVPVQQPGEAQRAVRQRVAALRELQRDQEAMLEAADRAHHLPDEGPHAHLRKRVLPLQLDRRTESWLLRLWAAATSSLVLAGLGLLLLTGRRPSLAEIALIAAALISVEALLRRRFVRLVVTIGIVAFAGTAMWWTAELVRRNLGAALGVALLVAAGVLAYLTISQGVRRR